MKKLLLLLFAGLFLAGCAAREEPEGDPVEFTVMTQEDAPEELKRQMEEKCREGFRLTYEDEGWLYAAVGYGARSGGGYSVQVCACRETENAISVSYTHLDVYKRQYKNKYQAGSTIETCPAKLSDSLTAQMQAYAEQVYVCLLYTSRCV